MFDPYVEHIQDGEFGSFGKNRCYSQKHVL